MTKNMPQSRMDRPIYRKAYPFVLCLILMVGCTTSRYKTAIHALADQGSPMQGADIVTLNSLIIPQVQDIPDGKILLYFLPDSKAEMAVTRVDKRGHGWRAVASDQQRISEWSGTNSDYPNGLKAFSAVLGKSPSYSVAYGFNRIGASIENTPMLHIVWEDDFFTCTAVDFGGFLVVREGDHTLQETKLQDGECL